MITNLVLILEGQRFYALDEVRGTWHRHPVEDSAIHNRSPEGQRLVSLSEFIDEVKRVIIDYGLL